MFTDLKGGDEIVFLGPVWAAGGELPGRFKNASGRPWTERIIFLTGTVCSLGHVCDRLLDRLYNADRLLAASISLMVGT